VRNRQGTALGLNEMYRLMMKTSDAVVTAMMRMFDVWHV
jgi:hypothetical protein